MAKWMPHDLLRLRDPSQLIVPCDSAGPDNWVVTSLRIAPFVVVRRAAGLSELIPVGVRGSDRNQRWACFVQSGNIQSVTTPMDLVQRDSDQLATSDHAALRAVHTLKYRWRALSFRWGPTGSVGFEFASGVRATKKTSDLDILLCADTRLSPGDVRDLHESTEGLGVRVDVQIETRFCAFSLREYADRIGHRILLRGIKGCWLGADPWEDNAPN